MQPQQTSLNSYFSEFSHDSKENLEAKIQQALQRADSRKLRALIAYNKVELSSELFELTSDSDCIILLLLANCPAKPFYLRKKLLEASREGDLKLLQALIEAKAPINPPISTHPPHWLLASKRCKKEAYPLYLAIENNQKEILIQLIAKGALLNLAFPSEKAFRYPYQIALEKKDPRIALILFEAMKNKELCGNPPPSLAKILTEKP